MPSIVLNPAFSNTTIHVFPLGYETIESRPMKDVARSYETDTMFINLKGGD